jgi:hypothetical protein
MTGFQDAGHERFRIGFVHRSARGISLMTHMPIPLPSSLERGGPPR